MSIKEIRLVSFLQKCLFVFAETKVAVDCQRYAAIWIAISGKFSIIASIITALELQLIEGLFLVKYFYEQFLLGSALHKHHPIALTRTMTGSCIGNASLFGGIIVFLMYVAIGLFPRTDERY